MTNKGKWDGWYTGLSKESPGAYRFGDTVTYQIGAGFLSDCKTVEDWGVGAGGFKRLRPDAIGVDGSRTPFADVTADLTEYRSGCDGIFMRHVLEHNEHWRLILANALESATSKVCIVLFTPFAETTEEVPGSRTRNAQYGVDVADFRLGRGEFDEIVAQYSQNKTEQVFVTDTGYQGETVVLIAKQEKTKTTKRVKLNA
jgi:hypothetical protein